MMVGTLCRWTVLLVPLLSRSLKDSDIGVTHALSASSNNRRNRPASRQITSKPLAKRKLDDVLVIERHLWRRGYDFVVGSDESGTGSVAGPIVAASCCVLSTRGGSAYRPVEGVDDSKRLSRHDRKRIYQHIAANPQTYALTVAYRWPNDYGIQHKQENGTATVLKIALDALRESIESLIADKLPTQHKDDNLNCSTVYSIVDGHKSPRLDEEYPCRPWKGGDATVYTVALASIAARVVRDGMMEEAANRYPQYEFHENGGYPSRRHMEVLHKHGPSPIHWTTNQKVRSRGEQATVTRRGAIVSTAASSLSMLMLPLLLVAPRSPKPAGAMVTDPRTGVALPEVGEVEASLPENWDGADDPFRGADEASMFGRLDSSSDVDFYSEPRLVEHVDDQAVGLMTEYVSNVAIQPKTQSVLDLCSSWTSHIGGDKPHPPRISGLGMNAKEMEANPALTDWTVQDLNRQPKLPYDDNSFDCVLCQLSIDYLTRPLEVCKEVGRVLKHGGTVHVLFSNRLFLQKAVAIWTGKDDIDHAYTVACYLHFCNGGFTNIRAKDLSVRKGRDKRIVGDPLYVVTATKA